MPALDAERRSLLSRHAAARRWNRPEADDLAAQMAEDKIAAYVRKVVDAAPPLSDAQRQRLATLLRGAGDG